MHFFAANLDWSATDATDAEAALRAMAARRRRAVNVEPVTLTTPAGSLMLAGTEYYAHVDDGLVVCVFNAEQVATGRAQAIARVLAEAWRRDPDTTLSRLPHPWQAVIVDATTRSVLIAVDRFCIGPLYYLRDAGDTLVVSSDLDAVVGHPGVSADIDPQALYDYLFFHCIPSPRTVYRQVAKCEPATALAWRNGATAVSTYWMPAFADGDAAADTQALLPVLRQAVAARAGDAPGAFLSGGLDSSTVAGLLAGETAQAPSYTIGFAEEGYDESAYARIAAEHFATDYREYYVTPADITAAWPEICAAYAEPFGNSSVIPTYYCAREARARGNLALLAGDGGDELFSGNERYLSQQVFERYLRLPRFVRGALEAGYELLPFLRGVPLAGKGYSYITQANMGLPDRLQSYNFLNRMSPAEMFVDEWFRQVDPEQPWQAWRTRYQACEGADPLHAMLFLDWKFTLADNDLAKVSTMCDLAGIAVRYPMLDQDVVEFAAALPARALMPEGRLRGFYKDAVRGFLPDAILDKSKHGFGLPFGHWMRVDAELNQLAVSTLSRFRERGIVRPQFVDRAISLIDSDAPGYFGGLVWIFASLEMWLSARGL